MLQISEIFRSLSGESKSQGLPAIFLRLFRCNLACFYCDTDYARSGTTAFELTVEQAADRINEWDDNLMVVSGGEPLLQSRELAKLLELFQGKKTIQVETNGTMPVKPVVDLCSLVMDVKTPDARAEKPFYEENLNVIQDDDEIKFVITSKNDFDFSVDFARKHALFDRPLAPIISPAHGIIGPENAAQWVLDSGLPFRVQIQLHKALWGANTRR